MIKKGEKLRYSTSHKDCVNEVFFVSMLRFQEAEMNSWELIYKLQLSFFFFIENFCPFFIQKHSRPTGNIALKRIISFPTILKFNFSIYIFIFVDIFIWLLGISPSTLRQPGLHHTIVSHRK